MDKDKQMSFLFEEGGIADDGMDRDPISGNEVPAGSLAKEVRDDIPAQLSEGEYVVPADVVRFYGVRFFEKLRSEAKEGLGEMEDNGRIGGEPVPSTDYMEEDDDLSPEERAELESIMGMAQGGMVNAAPINPMPANPLLDNPSFRSIRSGYAPGGDVTEADTQVNLGATVPVSGTEVQFSEQQFPAGFSLRSTPRSVAYVQNDEGETKFFILPDQQALYDLAISQGFRDTTAGVAPPEVVAEAGQTLQQVEQQDSGGGGGGFTTMGGGEPRDFSSMTTEELYSNLNGVNTMGKIGSALAIAVNPIFAVAMRGAFNASRLNIVQELEARGEDMYQFREDNGRDLYGGGLGLYDGLQDTNNDGEVNFGDTWFGDLLGFDGQAGVQGPGLRASRDGERRDFTPTVTRTTSAPQDSGGGGGQPAAQPSGSPAAFDSARESGMEQRGQTVSEATSGVARGEQGAREATSGLSSSQREGGADLDTAMGMSGLKEGGLVSRPKKKKKSK